MALINATAIPNADDYELEQSLKFNDNDSASLSWTPTSAGNRTTWTWSGWIKLGSAGDGWHMIFSAGSSNNPATIGFLAPSQNFEKTITHNRKSAMKLIARMHQSLQSIIPLQVGLYDDAFNLNCVGDTFQSKNTPTILIEAGHYHRDYRREHVRKFICVAILEGLSCIAKEAVSGHSFDDYFKIPLNYN